LTPAQMLKKGVKQGITFTGHGSTWLVLFALIPLVAWMVSEYGVQWRREHILLAALAGSIASFVIHALYTMAPFPDYMVREHFALTPAGWMHLVLFAAAITVFVLFFLATRHTAPGPVLFAAWYITGHVFVGNHMVIKMDPPASFPSYPLWETMPWLTVVAVGLIVGAASWSALR
ncbi:MAG: hypothetical protein AAB964_02460, partial [Patescibacteria group bacterium]